MTTSRLPAADEAARAEAGALEAGALETGALETESLKGAELKRMGNEAYARGEYKGAIHYYTAAVEHERADGDPDGEPQPLTPPPNPQALYPDAAFVIIVRHPIATAYATAAWAAKHASTGEGAKADPLLIRQFVEHWVHVHEILEADLPYLRNVHVLSHEELCAQPEETLRALFESLSLSAAEPLPPGLVVRERNLPYERQWRNEAEHTREAIRNLAPKLCKFGYSVEGAVAGWGEPWVPMDATQMSRRRLGAAERGAVRVPRDELVIFFFNSPTHPIFPICRTPFPPYVIN